VKLSGRAPGKVNLALFLGGAGSREDGRHELVTLIESVSLADEVTLTAPSASGVDEVECPGVPGPNLAGKALRLLRAAGWEAPPVRIEILKRVPVAAGMGGGSADAAAALRLAAALAPPPDGIDLAELAAGLGADVPSQLEPGLWLATGAGEMLAPVPPIAPHELVIVPSPATLSTAAVYREADRLGLGRTSAQLATLHAELRAALPAIDTAPATLPETLLVNDLEPAAVSLCPSIAAALADVRAAGADHAFVCGSGPTVAGLFWGNGRRAAVAATTLRPGHPDTRSVEPVATGYARVSAGSGTIPGCR
jgi:4-diphosphocytidyl-2-C-methyl-D-erythritol kinase